MSNQQITMSNIKCGLVKKKLRKHTNKYFCKPKVNKFRKQPIKLYVNAMHFWEELHKTSINIQHFTFNKYKNIKLYVVGSQKHKKSTVNLSLNMCYTKDSLYFQPWYSLLNNYLVLVNPQSNDVSVFNLKKLSVISVMCIHKIKNSKVLQQKKVKKLLTTRLKSSEISKSKLLSKRVVKFSKKWFRFERNKFKRFKTKYDGRDLKKKAPILSIRNFTASEFKKKLFKKYSNKFSLIKEMLIAEKDKNVRLAELFKKLKDTSKTTKKPLRYKYTKFKSIWRPVKFKHPSKVLRINIYNSALQATNSVVVVTSKNTTNISQKFERAKIKLLQRVSFVSAKANKRKASRYSVKTKRLKTTLKKINCQIKYKLKWSNFYEFKSFRWKFQKKRWHYTMSKWKRLAEFRRMLRNAWRNHRKLQKNFLFIKLLRANFKYILGIQESELLKKWIKIRRGTNSNNAISSIDYLNQALQLKLDGLSMFLGLAPNRLMAQELVRFGGLRVNGLVVTNSNFSMHQNDMLQIDSKTIQNIRALYKDAHWTSVRTRLKFAPFLQAQWSIMLFMLIRWPQSHELLEESILNQRWVRFFIRYFPVRISKYKKAKVKWYKY